MKMNDIAKLAGVSKSTVSRVINNSQNVRPELRKRVEKVLKETGYTPNLLAQELVTKKTKLIGVILPRIGIDTFSNITEGITEVLNNNEYNLLLANTNEKISDEFKYLEIFKKKHVDGIIFFPTEITEKHIQLLKTIEIPVVIIGKKNSEINVPYVIYDDYNASKEIVSFLVNKGHKKIAFIGIAKSNNTVGKLRKEGYLAALEENGIKIKKEYMELGGFEISSGYEAMKVIIDRTNEVPTAVFAVIDRLAFGAIQCLKHNLYNVPEDISVVGIDDMDISSVFEPTLTTVHYDYYKSGVCAAKLILNKIENGETKNKTIVMDYEIKVRNSTKEL